VYWYLKMSEEVHNPSATQEDGYEHSDAKVGPLAVLAVAVGLLVLIAVTGVAIMWRVMAYETQDTGTLAGSPLAGLRPLPPSPRLQITPAKDLRDTREQEHDLFSSYAWVEKDKGVVRIPIDRAMDLLAERGLPPGKPEPPAKKAVTQ
jgi:hypothetical protein